MRYTGDWVDAAGNCVNPIRTMLPEPIRSFLVQHIQTIESLEVLVLVSSTERNLTVEEIASALGLDAARVLPCLEALKTSGLADRTAIGAWCFAPRSSELREVSLSLVQIYGVRRIEVINAIVAHSLDRVRDFAEAFRLRARKPENKNG